MATRKKKTASKRAESRAKKSNGRKSVKNTVKSTHKRRTAANKSTTPKKKKKSTKNSTSSGKSKKGSSGKKSEKPKEKPGSKSPAKEGLNKSIPIGRTVKTQDKYLPIKKDKVRELKNKRWLVVIEKNRKQELAVVRLTDERQKNSTLLKGYRKGNKKDTYFKHFVEVEDNKGEPIKIDGVKFVENDKIYDLTNKQVKSIKEKVLQGVKQSSDNRKKIDDLKKE